MKIYALTHDIASPDHSILIELTLEGRDNNFLTSEQASRCGDILCEAIHRIEDELKALKK